MPISEDAYREPSWIRYREGYTIARVTNKRARFIVPGDYPRNYRGGDFKQAGYNPNHQSVRVEKVNLFSDDVTLRSR